MGYTHYWTQKRNFTTEEWTEIRTDIAAILTYVEHGCDCPLGNGRGQNGSHPVITDRLIQFNGIGESGHESFQIGRVRRKEDQSVGWDFCKTARKPYDLAVTACLCYLSTIAGSYRVTSDGHSTNYTAGLMAAREALPNKANMLDYPRAVMEDDRWTGPWVTLYSPSYAVRFCVDGKGYVHHVKDDSWYQFESHGALARFLHDRREARFQRGGQTAFGMYSKVEPNIWNAMGSFDKARVDRLARAQTKVLRTLFPVDAAHAVRPMAYVRPDDLQRYQQNSSFSYALDDLLAKVNGLTAI